MYTYTKAISLNEVSELSFPTYQMISSHRFHVKMSLKGVIKYFTIALVSKGNSSLLISEFIYSHTNLS